MENNEIKLSKKAKIKADEVIKRFQQNDHFLEIIRYFVSIDKDRFIVSETLDLAHLDGDFDSRENIIINKGELMLHKYLQMAQICYYATTNEELFPLEFVQGWKSGPMIVPLYQAVKANSNFLENIIKVKSKLEENIKLFIDKFYGLYKEYTLDDLIEFTQWDPAWQQINRKKLYQKKNANKLNIKKYGAVYKVVLKKQIEYFAS